MFTDADRTTLEAIRDMALHCAAKTAEALTAADKDVASDALAESFDEILGLREKFVALTNIMNRLEA